MLYVSISSSGHQQHYEHAAGPLEIGRGPQPAERAAKRLIVQDNYVSRDQLHIEELPSGLVLVKNLSKRKQVLLGDGSTLATGEQRELRLPAYLSVGDTTVELTQWQSEHLDAASLRTVHPTLARPAGPAPQPSLFSLGDSPSPEVLAEWMETVITLLGSAVDVPDYYDRAARGLVELIGLDVGMVLLRRDDNWTVAARFYGDDSCSPRFSQTLLNHVCQEKRTFYQDVLSLGSDIESLQAVSFVVASPIFGLKPDEVVGVLYGARTRFAHRRLGIQPLEAQLVQLLAAGVSANHVRSTALRTRVQFEQFFSPTLVRELERNADLLEGRNVEVTILVSDLRGFTALSEQLEPQITCRLIRDLMERLSSRIVENGGVIVDYAGDGILAMWNAPAAQADHAALAAQTALAMLGEMPVLNERWQPQIGKALQLGIGLNTGLAQVGNTGSSRKFKYGPHGYTVNLASRVQGATKRLGIPILLTESTQNRLGDRFFTRPLGSVCLSDVKQEVRLHELQGEVPSSAVLPDEA